eukprot:1467855-Pyramimonas_sp.AAC.1
MGAEGGLQELPVLVQTSGHHRPDGERRTAKALYSRAATGRRGTSSVDRGDSAKMQVGVSSDSPNPRNHRELRSSRPTVGSRGR